MKKQSTGWVIVNIGHPTTGWVGISHHNSFAYTRKDCIAAFVAGSNSPWRYWYRNYNFRCVKAKQTVETI